MSDNTITITDKRLLSPDEINNIPINYFIGQDVVLGDGREGVCIGVIDENRYGTQVKALQCLVEYEIVDVLLNDLNIQEDFLTDWETGRNWANVVCEPISKSKLAPRQARALLELAGRMATLGGFERVLDALWLADPMNNGTRPIDFFHKAEAGKLQRANFLRVFVETSQKFEDASIGNREVYNE